MNVSNYAGVAAKVAGLALCGFVAACGPSSQEIEAATKKAALDAKELNDTLTARITAMAEVAEARNIAPGEDNCRYMLSGLLILGVELSQKVKTIILNRCPN